MEIDILLYWVESVQCAPDFLLALLLECKLNEQMIENNSGMINYKNIRTFIILFNFLILFSTEFLPFFLVSFFQYQLRELISTFQSIKQR